MSTLFLNAFRGFPAILGVILGVIFYSRLNIWYAFIFAGIFIIGLICLLLGKHQIKKNPLFGWLFIELWIVSTIPITIFTTMGIVYLTLNSPNLFKDLEKPTMDTLASILVGAVTTFFALLWTKDIEESDGFFSPRNQFKSSLSDSFKDLHQYVDGIKWDAVYSDTVPNGPSGWDFPARYARAKILNV